MSVLDRDKKKGVASQLNIMSRRRERAELQESLKELQRDDLQDVVKVQQYVVGVTMGQYPFEHPNGPKIAPGSRYMPNQTEIDFTQRTRTSLYSNFFRCAFVGAFTPYITLRVFSLMQKRVIPTQRYMIWSSLGGMKFLTISIDFDTHILI